MAENPISHVVSVLKGAIEQIERWQSTVSTSSFVSTSSCSHVSKSSQVSIPALPVSTVSRPLPVSAMKVLVKPHYVIFGL